MKASYICCPEKGKAGLFTEELNSTLKKGQIRIRTAWSAVSAGTETAWYMGFPNTAQSFPYYPGYSASGYVEETGDGVTTLSVGDRVVTWTGHRSGVVLNEGDVFRIEDNSIDMMEAAFTHIATFPFLGIRKLRLEMGESVMIAGQGILGIIATQLARLSGAVPILVADLDPERRALALKMGADFAFSPDDADFVEQVKAATDGKGVNAVVEVTGKAMALRQALEYIAWMGRISLLGCTRISDEPIDFYKYIHRRGITLIGAHTATRPRLESSSGLWTERDDYATFLKYLATGRLRIKELVSHVVSPFDAEKLYHELANAKRPPLGVVFDWNNFPQQ